MKGVHNMNGYSIRSGLNILLFTIAAYIVYGCTLADVYNMQDMEGTVVDKATGEPLEGVMVIEVWEAGGGFEGHTVDYLPLRETETGSDGRYEFSARGTQHVDEGFLTADSPRLIYFKPGYIFTSESNRYHPDRRFEFNRRSDWHQKTIELESFEGTPEEHAKDLERFDAVLSNLAGAGRQCLWMGIPRTLAMVRKEDIRQTQLGADPKVGISAPWRLDELRKCSSFSGFFEVYSDEMD